MNPAPAPCVRSTHTTYTPEQKVHADRISRADAAAILGFSYNGIMQAIGKVPEVEQSSLTAASNILSSVIGRLTEPKEGCCG